MSTPTPRYSEETAVEPPAIKEVVFKQYPRTRDEIDPPLQAGLDRTFLNALTIVVTAASAMLINASFIFTMCISKLILASMHKCLGS